MHKIFLVLGLIFIAMMPVYAGETVYTGPSFGEAQLSIEIDFSNMQSYEIGFTREQDIASASEHIVSSLPLLIDHEDGKAKNEGNLYVYWNIRASGPFSITIDSDGTLDRIGGGGYIGYRIQLEESSEYDSEGNCVISVPVSGNGSVTRTSKGVRKLLIETDVIGDDILSGKYSDTLTLVLSDEA